MGFIAFEIIAACILESATSELRSIAVVLSWFVAGFTQAAITDWIRDRSALNPWMYGVDIRVKIGAVRQDARTDRVRDFH